MAMSCFDGGGIRLVRGEWDGMAVSCFDGGGRKAEGRMEKPQRLCGVLINFSEVVHSKT